MHIHVHVHIKVHINIPYFLLHKLVKLKRMKYAGIYYLKPLTAANSGA